MNKLSIGEFFEIVVGYQYIQLFCAIEGVGFQYKEFIFGSDKIWLWMSVEGGMKMNW